MDKQIARILIDLWLKDYKCFNIPKAAYDDLGVSIPENKPIRAFLASHNKAASDALWDNKPVTAMKILIKQGLGKADNRYRDRAARGADSVRKTSMRNQILEQLYREDARRSAWKVCK